MFQRLVMKNNEYFSSPEHSSETQEAIKHAQQGLNATQDFIVDQATDPLNYLGGGATVAGKAAAKGLFALLGAMKAEDAQAMFYGGKWLPKGLEDKLEKALSSGMSEYELFKKTGMFKDPQGKWKKYETDKGSYLKPAGFSKLQAGQKTTLGDLLFNPNLYKTFPGAAQIPVETLPPELSKKGIRGGFYQYPEKLAFLKSPGNLNDYLGTVLHEVQHAIQNRGQVSSGTMSSKFLPEKLTNAEKTFNTVLDSFNTRVQAYKSAPLSYKQSPEGIAVYDALTREREEITKFANKLDSMKTEAFEKYQNNPGEVEARTTANLRDSDVRSMENRLPRLSYRFEVTNPLYYNDPTQ